MAIGRIAGMRQRGDEIENKHVCMKQAYKSLPRPTPSPSCRPSPSCSRRSRSILTYVSRAGRALTVGSCSAGKFSSTNLHARRGQRTAGLTFPDAAQAGAVASRAARKLNPGQPSNTQARMSRSLSLPPGRVLVEKGPNNLSWTARQRTGMLPHDITYICYQHLRRQLDVLLRLLIPARLRRATTRSGLIVVQTKCYQTPRALVPVESRFHPHR